jgi:hypothetical protein
MYGSDDSDNVLSWLLLYTRPHAEAWAEVNLRNQGFIPLLPRVIGRSGVAPLFPRYLFVGHDRPIAPPSLGNTYGVRYVVQCGDRPARVPNAVIAELRGRMDERGIVHLETTPKPDELYAKRERDRVRALVKFAEAGFRVRSA